MPNDDILFAIKSMLGMNDGPQRFKRFKDGMGNFEMLVPEGWKCDEDIAVVDGKYTISFQPRDGLRQFTISVDARIPAGFSFPKYAKAELEGPSSGIYTPVIKSVFHKMPAFARKYRYSSGGRDYFGGGVMFFTGTAVFSLSWSAPAAKEADSERIFKQMKKSFAPCAGFVMREAMPQRFTGRDEA